MTREERVPLYGYHGALRFESRSRRNEVELRYDLYNKQEVNCTLVRMDFLDLLLAYRMVLKATEFKKLPYFLVAHPSPYNIPFSKYFR